MLAMSHGMEFRVQDATFFKERKQLYTSVSMTSTVLSNLIS